jgi:hypothetical protein
MAHHIATKLPMRMGLVASPQSKPPVLQFGKVPSCSFPVWSLWTSYNQDLTAGAYYEVHPDGRLYQVYLDNIGAHTETLLMQYKGNC